MLGAHDFEQLHHIRRRKEVQPDHVLRPLGHGRDFVDIERRCIGRQNGPLLHHTVEFSKDLALKVHVLKHGFNDQITVREISNGKPPVKAGHAGLDFILGKTPLVGRPLIIAAHDAQTTVQRLLGGLHDFDLDASSRKVHRNTAAHGTRPDDAHGFDRALGRCRIKTRHGPCISPRLRDVGSDFGFARLGHSLASSLSRQAVRMARRSILSVAPRIRGVCCTHRCAGILNFAR